MSAPELLPQDEAFEREIQAFLQVFPEFADEFPVMDVPAFRTGDSAEPQRCVSAKGAFGITVWLRFHEQGASASRDALISKFLEDVPGSDALYQVMMRRMSQL
jgi:hypothetical protein